jgi:hypothetical protein
MASPTTAETLPADIQTLVDQFFAIERETDVLLDALDDEQFNWSPAAGVWSIGQCFDHLNVTNAVYLERMAPALESARRAGWRRQGPLAPSVFGRLFVRQLEPPARYRMKAPRRIVPAAERRRKPEVWPLFVRTHSRIRACLAHAADLDLNRARFRNPFISLVTMRCGTAFMVMAAHDRRHLEQAKALRSAPGFPRG